MKFNYETLLVFIIIQISYINNSLSCGYDFVGGCSTGLALNINGTVDSFNVAECSFGNIYQNTDLGTVKTLFLQNSRSITWESCENNVSAVAMHYRIFQVGQPGSTWTVLNLPEAYNTAIGPYTTRYRRANPNTNLTTGLVVGKTYIIELYFRAEIDTLGNDFVPETELIQNNQGQNYQLRFTYGGPTAPPFTVVKTMQVNAKCYGDSSGIAGVSVYGDQSGLFYTWSYAPNNFNMEFNLPAGDHYVTVTGSGYTEVDTFTITQPDALGGNFVDIQNIGCDLSVGHATLVMSSGLAPFTYLWQDGQTTATNSFDSAGQWSVTATDAQGCDQDFEVIILGGGDLQISVTASGKQVDPCIGNSPIALTFIASTNALDPTFTWTLNGQVVSTEDTCVLISSTFPFPIPLLSVTDEATNCSETYFNNQLPILIVEPLPPPIAYPIINNSTGTNIQDGSVYLSVLGGNFPYSFLWNTGATTQNIFDLVAGIYCCTITDARGCSTTTCATVTAPSATSDIREAGIKIYPTLASAGDVLYIETLNPLSLAQHIELIDMQGRMVNIQPKEALFDRIALELPFNTVPGVYILRCWDGLKWGSVRVLVD